MSGNTICRKMSPNEYCLLEDFLYEAIFIPEGIELPPYDIIYLPELYMYIEDFGSRPSDLAVVAEVDGVIVGAAWARIMRDYGYVDDQTPSLSISLRPNFRGQGIGTKLWQTLLEHLYEAGYHQCSLSVQKANFATKIYLHSGFYIVRENPEDYVMVKRLRE